MTDITSTAAVSAQANSTGSQTSAANASDAAVADYDDFLTLLTAQLRNQDPLNPADGTEFVEQLATFTAVEQQIATVDRLEQLIALQNGAALVELAGWVGRSVTGEQGGINYTGEPVTLATPGEAGASAGAVVFRNADGQEVARAQIPPEGGSFTWDGRTLDGRAVDPGVYSVEFVYTVEGENGPVEQVRPYAVSGEVVEARVEEGDQVLFLRDGSTVRVDDVSAVRSATTDPQAPAEGSAEPTGEEETGLLEQAVDAVVDAL